MNERLDVAYFVGLEVDGLLESLQGLPHLAVARFVLPPALLGGLEVVAGNERGYIKLLQHLDDVLVVDGIVDLHFLGRVKDRVGAEYKNILIFPS